MAWGGFWSGFWRTFSRERVSASSSASPLSSSLSPCLWYGATTFGPSSTGRSHKHTHATGVTLFKVNVSAARPLLVIQSAVRLRTTIYVAHMAAGRRVTCVCHCTAHKQTHTLTNRVEHNRIYYCRGKLQLAEPSGVALADTQKTNRSSCSAFALAAASCRLNIYAFMLRIPAGALCLPARKTHTPRGAAAGCAGLRKRGYDLVVGTFPLRIHSTRCVCLQSTIISTNFE